jgi:hypothetical protein
MRWYGFVFVCAPPIRGGVLNPMLTLSSQCFRGGEHGDLRRLVRGRLVRGNESTTGQIAAADGFLVLTLTMVSSHHLGLREAWCVGSGESGRGGGARLRLGQCWNGCIGGGGGGWG